MNLDLISIMLLSIPVTLVLASICSQRMSNDRRGMWLVNVSYFIVLLFITAVVMTLNSPNISPEIQVISHTNISLIMLGLVVFMSVILIAFSRNYMAREPKNRTYWFWLLNTLAAVSFVVISNHLLLFWLGWVFISLALHKLLTFYPERPRAALAAHKKFLLARCAELSLFIAIVLLYQQHGTLLISELMTHFIYVANDDALNLTAIDQVAAVLIALTALIKCAQLPLHGWLIQVVEAPTPISALLHAGVINLGGFLLILFAPLFIQSVVAQWLVIIVAGGTCVIAALVMATRISVKVRLAWSTSAQMGLMLLECALGLFELALLHLITHSVYKAYAFLNSGNAVYEDIQARLAPAAIPNWQDWLFAGLCSSAMVIGTVNLSDYQGVWSVWVLFILALTLLIAERHNLGTQTQFMPVLVTSILLLVSYSTFKGVFGFIIPHVPALSVAAFSAADVVSMALFISLFLLSWLVRYKADHPSIKRLSIMLFAGLYLDEWLTRLTLKIWPIRLPNQAKIKILNSTEPCKESSKVEGI